MRITSLCIPLLMVASASCAGRADGTIDITFDPCRPLRLDPEATATAAQRDGVSRGLALWNGAAGSRLTLDEVPDAPRLPIRFGDAALAFRGLYDDEHAIVFINRDLTDDHQLAVTVAHEVGHAFGLLHVDPAVRPSVMNKGNITIEPTEADVSALALLWGRCDGR